MVELLIKKVYKTMEDYMNLEKLNSAYYDSNFSERKPSMFSKYSLKVQLIALF